MAHRRYEQFIYSHTHKLTSIHGSFTWTPAVAATLVTQGITMTAATAGLAGNSITLAFTGGGTAGSEVVSVVGNAISVQIETGVSTITQVVAALQASAPSQAKALATGSGATPVVTASALNLSGGLDVAIANSVYGAASIARSAAGEVTIVLQNVFNAIMSSEFQVLSATAQDIIPQVKSIVLSTKTIVVNLNAAGTPTDPSSAIRVFVRQLFRDSSVTI